MSPDLVGLLIARTPDSASLKRARRSVRRETVPTGIRRRSSTTSLSAGQTLSQVVFARVENYRREIQYTDRAKNTPGDQRRHSLDDGRAQDGLLRLPRAKDLASAHAQVIDPNPLKSWIKADLGRL